MFVSIIWTGKSSVTLHELSDKNVFVGSKQNKTEKKLSEIVFIDFAVVFIFAHKKGEDGEKYVFSVYRVTSSRSSSSSDRFTNKRN